VIEPLLASMDFDAIVLPLGESEDLRDLAPLQLLGDVVQKVPVVAVGLRENLAAKVVAFGAQDYLTLDEMSGKLASAIEKAIVRHRGNRQQTLDTDSLRELLQVDADGWLIVDPNGHILLANEPAERLLGQSGSELQGQNFGVPTDSNTMEIEIVRQTDHGPQMAILDVRLMEIQWQGEPAFLELLRDVTDYKQQLRSVRDAIRQRDQFLATLSHELRNPPVPRRFAGSSPVYHCADAHDGSGMQGCSAHALTCAQQRVGG